MWAWNQPCSVLRKSKVKASNDLLVPSQMKRLGRISMSGWNCIGVAAADLRIEAVGGDDEVGVGEFEVGIDLALEDELDAERLAAPLQDVEQLLAADADEAMARRAHARGP